jgi:hypothetical protein
MIILKSNSNTIIFETKIIKNDKFTFKFKNFCA